MLEVSDGQFEKQLALAASRVKDSLVGLYDPESMMWHVVSSLYFMAPAELCYSNLHTSGLPSIDEHSKNP